MLSCVTPSTLSQTLVRSAPLLILGETSVVSLKDDEDDSQHALTCLTSTALLQVTRDLCRLSLETASTLVPLLYHVTFQVLASCRVTERSRCRTLCHSVLMDTDLFKALSLLSHAKKETSSIESTESSGFKDSTVAWETQQRSLYLPLVKSIYGQWMEPTWDGQDVETPIFTPSNVSGTRWR